MRHYGLTGVSLPTHRLADPTTCQELLREAGFLQIEVRSEQLGYYLPTAQERWADINAGLEGKSLLQLTPAEHLAELAELATSQGIEVDVPALFAFGRPVVKGVCG